MTIQATLKGQNRTFWCQCWWKHQSQYFFWWIEDAEVNEATEVVEAVEVNEAAEVPNAREITQYVKCVLFFYFQRPKWLLRSLRPVMLSCLLRSLRPLKFSEPLRFLKSIIYWLESPYFDVLKKKTYWLPSWNFSEILPKQESDLKLLRHD